MNMKAQVILEQLASIQSGTVVEVGAIRFGSDVLTDGFSTVHLGRYCFNNGIRFISLEKSSEVAGLANAVLASHGLPYFTICADAASVLRTLGTIDVLYLDGSDDPLESLDQFLATTFGDQALLLVDDCQEYAGNRFGKGTLIAAWLDRHRINYELLDTETGFRMMVAHLCGSHIKDLQDSLHVNIISNLDNEAGLQREAGLLRALIEEFGHSVSLVHVLWPEKAPFADINLFDETPITSLLATARRNWIFPHAEWWDWDSLLARFDRLLAKTSDCLTVFRRVASSVDYLGFTSEDHYDPTVAKSTSFLHIQGKSNHKNTEAVVNAWREFEPPAELVVIGSDGDAPVPNVTFLGQLTEPRLAEEQNRHQFHLCPSEYEGWGHALHEGLGVGAVVITTAAPPMSEFAVDPRLLVPVASQYSLRKAIMNKVSPRGIYDTVLTCLELTADQIATLSDDCRQLFSNNCKDFRTRLGALLTREKLALRCEAQSYQKLPFDVCILTAPRPERYLDATLTSLVCSSPTVDWKSHARLQVGADESTFPVNFPHLKRIAWLTANEFHRQLQWTPHRRLMHNLWRALSSAPDGTWGTCICEDDLIFRQGFAYKLMQALEEIRCSERSKYLLAAYSHFDSMSNPNLARGRFYRAYEARAHYGNCCLFVSNAVRKELAEYLWIHGIERERAPADLLVGEFCQQLKDQGEGEMFQSVVSIAQHVGFVSGGTSDHYSASPTFSQPWPD